MAKITCDAFIELESEVQQEFYEDVINAIDDINQCVSQLDDSIDDSVIDRMFRSIHTVKGNCNMVLLGEFVDALHRLEDLFSSIRSKTIEYNPVYGHFAIKIVNLVQIELACLIENKYADGDILENIQSLLEEVEGASSDSVVATTTKAITAIDDGHYSISLVEAGSSSGTSFSFLESTDFEYLQYLSNRTQNTSRFHTSFFNIALNLAVKLNNCLNNKVDEQQLEVAIIALHLSQRFEVNGQAESLSLQHVIFSHGLLSRMAGWDVAAQLCLQSLENHDGLGQPLAISGAQIIPAAQVVGLSCEFAFYVLNSNSTEYKQSLFAAVKAINAQKNTRFKDKLIDRFTQLIKSEYLSNKMF